MANLLKVRSATPVTILNIYGAPSSSITVIRDESEGTRPATLEPIKAMNIRQIKDDDIVRITEIYNWYILNTTITFETEVISPLKMKERVQEKVEKYNWLVGESNQEIIGYAYYGSFRSRPAYSHTVELTIYLAQESIGKGFGKSLYSELVKSAKEHGFRELIGVIALPNQGSTVLHQKLGFEEIGVLKKVGRKFDRYVDVGIWQKSTS